MKIQTRILVIGDNGSGKTSWTARHTRGHYVDNSAHHHPICSSVSYTTTIGIVEFDFVEHRSSDKGLWPDRVDGIILFIDLSTTNTNWDWHHTRNLIEDKYGKSIPVVLCGNKHDISRPREELANIFDVIDNLHHHPNWKYCDASSKREYNHEAPLIFLIRKICRNETIEII